MNRLAVFPLIKQGKWTFRTTVADQKRILIYAFGPEQNFQMRFFTDVEEARAYVEAISNRVV